MFVLGVVIGAVLGGLVMVFVVRANPKLIVSANKIKETYESIKDIA